MGEMTLNDGSQSGPVEGGSSAARRQPEPSAWTCGRRAPLLGSGIHSLAERLANAVLSVCLDRVTSQNATDRVAYKQQTSVSYSFGG